MRLHKEGRAILRNMALAIIVVAVITFYLLHWWSVFIIVPLLVLYGFMIWFFRNPARLILDYSDEIVAPVDGKVVMIKEVEENEYLKEKCIQISIFMSPLNVHICRYPVTGKVIYNQYHKGKYLVAFNEKSSELNERTTTVVKTMNNQQVLFRQIAGYVARRIVSYTKVTDDAKAGFEYGFIKFGSRMDVFVPLSTEIQCKIGDKTTGGLDVIGLLK